MSVILFGADELAAVLLWYLDAPALVAVDAKETAASLALYSRANARAARATWHRSAPTSARARAETRPCSAGEILEAARAQVKRGARDSHDTALTVRLMHYNAISNDGRDHASRAVLAFLLSLALKLARDLGEREHARTAGPVPWPAD